MTTQQTSDYGTLVTPDTVTLQRLLPGPIERVWRYLTEPELRRTWLAAGDLELAVDGDIELIFRNDEFVDVDDPASPEPTDDRIAGVILACDPPRLLSHTWGDGSEVTFTLVPVGDRVQLDVVHRKLPDRASLLGVSSGWHTHLDLLLVQLDGGTPEPFWTKFRRLEAEYARRIPE